MNIRKLARTDLQVSPVCLGTMTFGAQTLESDAHRMVGMCLDAGVNLFDTANVYNQGRSEEILGKVLGSRRSQVLVASKVRGNMRGPSEYGGLSREAIHRAIHDSLQRLGTDYLDLYYLHMPDDETPAEETLETMEGLRKEGKIRHICVSNYSAWQICEMHSICERNGWQKPWISQPMYNLIARGIEQEYLPFTRRYGISNICYNPLAGGLLTGKQSPDGGPLAGTRFDGNEVYLKRYWHPGNFESVRELGQIAKEAGLTLVQLSLAWLLNKKDVHSVLLGASRPEQLQETLQAVEAPPLDAATLEACDRVWSALRGPAPVYNR